MITTRFDYKLLSRTSEQGRRLYLTPDGDRLPSVTTILDATKSEESRQALQNWRNRVGHTKAQEITTEAASRGTRMHKWLENYVNTNSTGEPGSNPYSLQSHQMAHCIIQNGLSKCSEFWGTEVGVYFPKIYAGTTDCIGVHDGAEAIIDFKQTNKPKKREWIEDYFVQLLMYATAHNEVHGSNIRKGVILMCSADKEYQEFIIEGSDWELYASKMWARLEQYYSQIHK
jgi:genome maintenance exonuclease 1